MRLPGATLSAQSLATLEDQLRAAAAESQQAALVQPGSEVVTAGRDMAKIARMMATICETGCNNIDKAMTEL